MKVPTTRGTSKPLYLLPCAWTLSHRSVQSLLPHFSQVSGRGHLLCRGLMALSDRPTSTAPLCSQRVPSSCPSVDLCFTWYLLAAGLLQGNVNYQRQGLVSLYARTYNGASCRVNTQGAFAGRRNMWLAQSVLAYLLSSVYTHTYIYTYIYVCVFSEWSEPTPYLWPCILCVFLEA